MLVLILFVFRFRGKVGGLHEWWFWNILRPFKTWWTSFFRSVRTYTCSWNLIYGWPLKLSAVLLNLQIIFRRILSLWMILVSYPLLIHNSLFLGWIFIINFMIYVFRWRNFSQRWWVSLIVMGIRLRLLKFLLYHLDDWIFSFHVILF